MDRSIPPLDISPAIRTARWGFLIAGILYGAARLKRLQGKEDLRVAELERTRPEREAKAKLEREKLLFEQMAQLEKELGIKIN